MEQAEGDPEAPSEHQAARRAARRCPGDRRRARARVLAAAGSRPSGPAAGGSGGYAGVDAAPAPRGADADAVQGGRVRGVPGRGPGGAAAAGDAAAVLPQVPLRVRPPLARHPPGLPLLPRARAVRRHARPPGLALAGGLGLAVVGIVAARAAGGADAMGLVSSSADGRPSGLVWLVLKLADKSTKTVLLREKNTVNFS